MMQRTHVINSNLSVSVEDGEHEQFIKIKRGEKWICLSPSLWKIINLNLDKLRNIDQILYLTRNKRLEVINYKGKRYVSFVQESHFQGSDYKYYINFNDDEWAILLDKIPPINSKLGDSI